jgi:hypothetical protein
VIPEEAGTVIGGGTFPADTIIILTAEANIGYTFDHWQDNNNENPRTITVTGDSTFTAYFSEIPVTYYTINTKVIPEWAGTVTGGGTFPAGTPITLIAEAYDGYTFDHWKDGDTTNPRQITVTEDATYIAYFEETHCIDDLQAIQPKYHTEDYDRYIMILIYPNLNDEVFEYQWRYSYDNTNYSNLNIGTYNKQYYYKGGRLNEGYYKVRVSKNGCYDETEAFYVPGSHLRIYPNPSHRGNEIVIMNDCDGPALLTLYSIDGRLLHTQTVTDKQATLDISLPQGIYVAYLADKEGYTKVGKLIIH